MDKDLKTQQELYDQGWRNGLEAGKEQRGNLQTNLEFLDQTGILKTEDKILEIGCGIGTIVSELTGRGHDIFGTDISNRAIDYGLKKYVDIRLEVQAAEVLPYDNESFDVVLSFDLLEHIAKVDRHISEVSRVLRQGGYYLLQTPNKYSNIAFETLSKKSLQWRRYHPSLHTPGQLKRRFGKHGFTVEFVKMNPINEFTAKKLEKFGPLGRLFTRVNFKRLPLALQSNLYVVARKS